MRLFCLFILVALTACNTAQGRLAEKFIDQVKDGHGDLIQKVKNYGNQSLCERIHPEDLPEECFCREPGPLSLVVECVKVFNNTYFNDTIGMKIDVDPCNKEGSRVSVDVTEKDYNIDFPISGIRAGEETNIPIPGLAIMVPAVGHVGVDLAVLVTGNVDSLTMKIGLNACAALATKQLCASAIPGLNLILPWYVLQDTYSFGDICENATKEPSETTKTTTLATGTETVVAVA
jgi:hypothetical protein